MPRGYEIFKNMSYITADFLFLRNYNATLSSDCDIYIDIYVYKLKLYYIIIILIYIL